MNIFLDLDGTLVDTKEGLVMCFQYALSQLGYKVPPVEDLLEYIGPPIRSSFRKLLNTDDEYIIGKAIDFFRELYTTEGIYKCRLYDGIKNLLEALYNRSHTLYVVTAKPTIFAKKLIDYFGLSPYIKEVYGCELDYSRTDKTESIRYVLEKESIKPEDAIMIGDRKHDVIGAHANGMKCIGVTWGYGSLEELTEAGADRVCAMVGEVLINFTY
jgi:phosphoglycolate phosphatase